MNVVQLAHNKCTVSMYTHHVSCSTIQILSVKIFTFTGSINTKQWHSGKENVCKLLWEIGLITNSSSIFIVITHHCLIVEATCTTLSHSPSYCTLLYFSMKYGNWSRLFVFSIILIVSSVTNQWWLFLIILRIKHL